MSTPAPPTEGTTHFGTTLRVTAEAVELRDRSYRLDTIRSARAAKVRSNRTMLAALVVFTAFVLPIFYISLRIVLDADPKFLWNGFGIAAMLLGLAINAAFFIGLVVLYRSTMKGWHYVYLARVQRKLWYTDIAASLRPEPIDQVVFAVNQALNRVSSGGAPLPQEPATLYYEEHSVRIEDDSLEVDGQAYPTGNVVYASHDAVSVTPWYILAFNHGWYFLIIGIYSTLSRNLSSTAALVLIVGVAVGLVLIVLSAGRVVQHVNRDKHPPIGVVYECKLHTAKETRLAFVSTDREFVKATADAVNTAVRKQPVSTRKHTSTTGPAQQTTP